MAQQLPPDTPPELVRVAWAAVCPPIEAEADLLFTVELIVAGAERLRDPGAGDAVGVPKRDA